MNKKRNYLLYAIIVILIVVCIVLYLKNNNLNRQMNENADELITIALERDELIASNKQLDSENKLLKEEKRIIGTSILNVSSVLDDASAELEKVRRAMGLKTPEPYLKELEKNTQDLKTNNKNNSNAKEEVKPTNDKNKDEDKKTLVTKKFSASETSSVSSKNDISSEMETPFAIHTESPIKDTAATKKPTKKESLSPFATSALTDNVATSTPEATKKPSENKESLSPFTAVTPDAVQTPAPNTTDSPKSTVKP